MTLRHEDDQRHRGIPAISDLLDAIEAGEPVTVTRGNKPIAEIRPARRRTGSDLRAALAGIPAPDEQFAADVNEAMAAVAQQVPDPWRDA